MPGIVSGRRSARAPSGSLDVVSLGIGGEIVLSFEPNGIVDGPGADFIVFENAFYRPANPKHARRRARRGERERRRRHVEDVPVRAGARPTVRHVRGMASGLLGAGQRHLAGRSGDAGGEPFDLAELGVASARFVRIRDLGTVDVLDESSRSPTTVGFDLDAIARREREEPLSRRQRRRQPVSAPRARRFPGRRPTGASLSSRSVWNTSRFAHIPLHARVGFRAMLALASGL